MSDKPASPALSAAETSRPANVWATALEYPPELPISAHREQLVALIRTHPAIVVCGETGSGKSTQLPKFCLEAGMGRDAMIGHTQPRRLAARSIAARLASELGSQLGEWVGYQVRFGDQTSRQTRIKLMTDGILLAETQSDPQLRAYDAIIIDEAHERSLNIDFLLGYLRRLQTRRPELKVIITSATIDAERFADHFASDAGPAPIINVEGRGYPVEFRYLPWDEVTEIGEGGYDLARHVIAGIEAAGADASGDTLVFLPTERDIREVSHRVAGHLRRRGLIQRVDLLPLYARLPTQQQQQIFQPTGGRRRIILATNVAESSLTVPGIRCVVDSGTARISRYSPRTKIQRLPIEPISRASADQRAGRCGRVGPGVCVRLYAEQDYAGREAYTTPEIRRTNLAAVILKTKTLRLGRLSDFPLLDPPHPEAIREGIRTLRELGAIDAQEELTETGWQLGRMPVDPRVGRILIAAASHGVLPEVLPIAAALEIQDPRERPPEHQQAADEAHRKFTDDRSDFLSYLRLWRYYEQTRRELGRNRLARQLRKQFLSPHRLREWSEVYRQLRELAGQSAGAIGPPRYEEDERRLVSQDRYAAIHQSLLAGLLSGIAMLTDQREYRGAGGLKLHLWPGSGLFTATPQWIVAAELVETAKQYARTVARIQPSWIEQAGQHLLKRAHQDPHWSTKSNAAFCYEQGTLFGLPIYTRRRVPLPPIDPATARDLLIDPGLAEDQLRTSARSVHHNRALVAALMQLAAKTRRRDLVVDRYAIIRFYQSRLPAAVVDRQRLERLDRDCEIPAWSARLTDPVTLAQWLQAPPPHDASESLYMRPADLVAAPAEPIVPEAFPDELQVGSVRLPLEYRFEPGSQRDGVNLRVHQAALPQLSEDRLGWLVPGLLQPKLVALIKSLPKRIRRNLVPAVDVAARVAEELTVESQQVPFLPAVCRALSRHADMEITATDFQRDKLDANLNMLVTVVNDAGETIAESRDLQVLLRDSVPGDPQHEGTPRVPGTSGPPTEAPWWRDAMTEFEPEELPVEVVSYRGGVQVAQYPGLLDLGDAVATQLYADPLSAEASLRQGGMRLFALGQHKQLRSQVRWLPTLAQAKLNLTGWPAGGELESQLIDLLARISFVDGEPPLRTRAEFERRLAGRAERIAAATQDVAGWLGQLADHYLAVRRRVETLPPDRFAAVLADVRRQLDWLLFDRCLSLVPWRWLQHYPRYLAAIDYRLDKIRSGSASRDADTLAKIEGLWQRWLSGLAEPQRTPASQVASEFRWLSEELRVSLFAQPLGTAEKVSLKRCERLL